MDRHVRIGCYSAFWGDTANAARQLVEAEDAQLSYLVADYLAEVTMGLLARSYKPGHASKSAKKPVGYIKEFLTSVLHPLLPKIVEKEIKVITNAGGLDPVGLKELIEEYAAEVGLSDKIKIAAVYGDDILDRKDDILRSKHVRQFDPLNGSGTAETMITEGDTLLSLNAYIGAEPIAKALRAGATIIVTGRCVDSAAVVGPLAFEYGWDFSRLFDQDTLDRLASASLAGHILECGAQATGGNFTDWKLSAGSPFGGWANMGYPIATFQPNGNFIISKPEKTGGIVTKHSVCEQMLYEVLDPGNYVLPDVVVDLSSVQLSQISADRVLVTSTRGKPPTPWLKCTAIEHKGYRVMVDLLVFGEEEETKGITLGHAVLERTNSLIEDIFHGKVEKILASNSKVIIIGAEQSLSPISARRGSREIVVRIAAKHLRAEALDVLSREVASFGTSSAPGLAMLVSGRPKVSPNLTTASILVRRESVMPLLVVGRRSSSTIEVPFTVQGCKEIVSSRTALTVAINKTQVYLQEVGSLGKTKLLDIAVGRSGDKGDTSNVAIIARTPTLYPYVIEQVTPEMIFSALGQFLQADSTITRHDVPGVHAVNFVITQSLGGGGLDSLALDRQGKGYAQICLESLYVHVPLAVLASTRL